MKFDIDTATDEEKARLLNAKILDVVTGEEIKDVAAFDADTGWRRQYVDDLDRPDRIMNIAGRSLNLGKHLKLVEINGNPLRVEFPA